MDWFPWYPDLYAADTMHLSMLEDCAYRRLIDHYMRTRRPLPESDQALARIIGIGLEEWLALKPKVVVFFHPDGGALSHKRCDHVLDEQDRKHRNRSERAKRGAAARHKQSISTAQAEHMPASMPATGEDKREEDSVANATGADAPGTPLDLKRELWKRGKALLRTWGFTEKQAGELLGRWRKGRGDVAVLDALARAEAESPSDPVAFVEGCLKHQGERNGMGAGKAGANGRNHRPSPGGVVGAALEILAEGDGTVDL
jgi:uncharacterized protein YdaU (DUF1376 family)